MAITLTGIPFSAVKGTGGVSAVFLASIESPGFAYTLDLSTGIATFNTDVSTAAAFTAFVPLKGTANYTAVGTPNKATASLAYKHTLAMTFGKTDTIKQAAINKLASTEVMAVVVDMHNFASPTCIFIGMSGMTVAPTNQSGTAATDLNGYTIAFESDEGCPAFIVDASTSAKLIAKLKV